MASVTPEKKNLPDGKLQKQRGWSQGRVLPLNVRLQCFREVTGPWYNKHINMKEGGALQANTGVASSMLPNSFLLTRNSNWSSDTNAIQAMAAQKARRAPYNGHLTQLPP